MNMQDALERLTAGDGLTRDEAQEVFGIVMAGEAAQSPSVKRPTDARAGGCQRAALRSCPWRQLHRHRVSVHTTTLAAQPLMLRACRS